jgi:hypothetical protein
VAERIDPATFTSEQTWRGLLGTRISVRYRTEDPEHPHGSSAGLLQSVGPGPDGVPRLVILTRRGEERNVSLDAIEVAKLISP